jgi:ketosteroid isomerase-like protein
LSRMLVIALLSLLLPCLTLGQIKEKKEKAKAAGGGTAQQAVEKVDDEIWGAGRKGDAAVFEKILADNYVRIGGDGRMFTKAETVDLYKSGRLKWDTIDLKNRKVRMFGNTAIVTREDNVKGHMGSNEISGTYRTTVVYVKTKNGQWQSASFQTTKVQ